MKSSVSALQEYCAKRKIPPPTYTYIDPEEDGSFVCQIEMDSEGVSAQASGRSKRDAKHFAAAAAIAKLRRHSNVDFEEIPPILTDDSDMAVPTTDMVQALRDYCVANSHPLPIMEIVQQSGTSDAPEFTALCTLASIQRYGVSVKKKDARQKAAYEILRLIREEHKVDKDKQVATLETTKEEVEEERYLKFKTYRELTESTLNDVPGVLLCDRHNHFKKYYDHIKAAARRVLNDESYESEKSQALDLLAALKIKPKSTRSAAALSVAPLICIELDCDYDVIFVDLESDIYKTIIDYFRDMLD